MIRNIVTMGMTDIGKSVVKATYDDELPPKEKHCVFLTECSNQYDLVNEFDSRLTMPRWNVVFKTLIVLHRLTIEGGERFMKDLAQNHHTFNLHTFFDASGGAQEHQEFIAKYADYLAQKMYVYKLLGVSVERRPPTESKEWARKLSGFDLVKALPALSQQFDKILLCTPYGGSSMSAQIPVCALGYLVKDAFRIYSTLTVLMLGVVDHYLELDAPQTKLILTVCRTFRAQNLRFKKWTTELAEVGFSHDKLFPELVPIPDALFELLQDHINVKSGGASGKASSSSSVPAAQPGKKGAPAAAVQAGKKAAPAGKKKPVPVEDDDEEEEEKDAMDSDSDEDEPAVKKVTKKVAAVAVSGGKKAAASAPAPTRKPAPVPAQQEEEEEEEEEEESETEEERQARKAAKKAKKEAKKAKKEAKKAKHKKKAESSDEEEEEEEEEEPAPKPKKSKSSSTSTAAAVPAADPNDIFATLAASSSSTPSRQSQSLTSNSPGATPMLAPNYAMPPFQPNVFNPYPGQQQQQYGGDGQPPQQQYGSYGGAPAGVPYGHQQQGSYGGGPGFSPLAGLQPLSSSAPRGRGSASFSPGEENTTAVGGIHDPNAGASAGRASAVDPFGDLAPDLSAAKPTKGRR